jgi:uncharacterized membrane protein
LDAAITRLYPEQIGGSARVEDPLIPAGSAGAVRSEKNGYLDRIDHRLLVRTAERADVVIALRCTPGTFVVSGDVLADVWPGGRADDAADGIRRAVLLGSRRTAEQDVRFIVNQLVEVAVRALSPAVNDPFTAAGCVDHLSAGISELARRRRPSPNHFDAQGRVRVIAPYPSFAEVLDEAFDPIRRASTHDTMVSLALLRAFGRIAERLKDAEGAAALARQASLVAEHAATVLDDQARQNIRQLHAHVQRHLTAPSSDHASDSAAGTTASGGALGGEP